MNYNWDWGVFFKSTGVGSETYLDWYVTGLGWTIAIAIVAWIIALLLGSILGVMRTVPNRIVSGIATCYVELFRNVPLLVQLFIWYFLVPDMLPQNLQDWYKQDLNPTTYSVDSSCIGMLKLSAAGHRLLHVLRAQYLFAQFQAALELLVAHLSSPCAAPMRQPAQLFHNLHHVRDVRIGTTDLLSDGQHLPHGGANHHRHAQRLGLLQAQPHVLEGQRVGETEIEPAVQHVLRDLVLGGAVAAGGGIDHFQHHRRIQRPPSRPWPWLRRRWPAKPRTSDCWRASASGPDRAFRPPR